MTSRPYDSVFWIEVEKISPNPYQPRRVFNEQGLQDLSDSIRQYGVLQPLVVTRVEKQKEDGGIAVEYELIAGERRLRASKLAGVAQVPAVIRSTVDDARTKLELAIIENLQREDLNPLDRAKAFSRLAEEFGFKHTDIAKKVGKSREYVSNSMRLLLLPESACEALAQGKMSEGHARTMLMLTDRPQEQAVLFKEIMYKKLTVRETEQIARRIAFDKVRKKDRAYNPEIVEIEEKFSETLGTRVQIEQKENGGRVMIDFFSADDLRSILDLMKSNTSLGAHALMNKFIASQKGQSEGPGMDPQANAGTDTVPEAEVEIEPNSTDLEPESTPTPQTSQVFEPKPQQEKEDPDLYSMRNFSI